MMIIVKTSEEIAEVYMGGNVIARFKRESWSETLEEAETYCKNIKSDY